MNSYIKKTAIFLQKQLQLPKLLSFGLDILMICSAWFGAYLLRFNFSVPDYYLEASLALLPWILAIQFTILLFFRLDKIIPSFASLNDLLNIVTGSAMAVMGSTFFMLLKNRLLGCPRSIPVLDFILLVIFLAGWRIFPRIIRERSLLKKSGKRILIVGAGNAGEMLVRDIRRQNAPPYTPVGFVDDNRYKLGKMVQGLPVLGKTRDIPRLVREHDIEVVILAMPSANRRTIRRLTELCKKANVPCHTLPSTNDLISGKITLNDIRTITIEDLLGREPVQIDRHAIMDQIQGKTILVTGAGGSIGSELCRQIAYHNPKSLVALDSSEYNLYELDLKLKKEFPELGLKTILGDIRNKTWLEKLLNDQNPYMVFHAAAYKHVPMVELNAAAGVDNNIIGTINLAKAACNAGVKKFIMISTDKAVNPTNVMGATKRIAEIYCQNLDRYSETAFITTRFGNVLDSSGSVIPLFKKQIAAGGPVTVTHPDIERFFMTIPEACQLVLQAATMGTGGEIFVLDMGEPVKIKDMAEQLIRLSGLEPYRDIDIKFIGLRPGEKLFEELFHPSEKLKPTAHPKILLARSIEVEWVWFQAKIRGLFKNIYDLDNHQIKQKLMSIIPEYKCYSDEDEKVRSQAGSAK